MENPLCFPQNQPVKRPFSGAAAGMESEKPALTAVVKAGFYTEDLFKERRRQALAGASPYSAKEAGRSSVQLHLHGTVDHRALDLSALLFIQKAADQPVHTVVLFVHQNHRHIHFRLVSLGGQNSDL